MTDDSAGVPTVSLSHFPSSAPDFRMAKDIRRAVFINEQNVTEREEWDAEDDIATHVLASVNGVPAGTARFYPEDGWLKIGRVAVLPSYRGTGVGHTLLRYCLELGAKEKFTRTFLNAQSDKKRFYEKHGFRQVGAEFDEAGIPHIRMERDVQKIL